MDEAELEQLRQMTAKTGAVASHGTAAQLWGMRLRHPPTAPTVTVARGRSKVRQDGFVIRRRVLSAGDRWFVDGIPVTSRLQTVVDNARTLPLPEGVVVADSALQNRLITPAELAGAARRASGPGATSLRRVSALADGRAPSVPESLLRLMLLASPRLGTVVPQFIFPGRVHPYDLALIALCLVIEFQSWEFHGERSVWKRDATWGNEAHAEGWGYLQIVWEDLAAGIDHIEALIMGKARNQDG